MSPSQASETCASASSTTSAMGKSLCEWDQTVSRKQNCRDVTTWVPTKGRPYRIRSGVSGNPLTRPLAIIVHASPSSFAITQEIIPHFAISPVTQYEIIVIEVTIASYACSQDIANSSAAWSATVPTASAGVVTVSEFCAFLLILRQARRASRPTSISVLASPLSPTATLP